MNRLQQFREKTLVFLTHHAALPLLRLIHQPRPFPCTEAMLAAFAPGTVGAALHRFHADNGLQLLPQYEQHDVKHVLMGYGATEQGEVCLQAFLLGNGLVTPATLITFLFGLCTMPEYWPDIRRAYRRGRGAAKLHAVDWAAILPEKLDAMRLRFNIPAVH